MGTKRYSNEEKMKILREHLDADKPISELADLHDVHPNAIYVWKKNLFENGAELLGRKSKSKTKATADAKAKAKIAELENTLRRRENLIAEVVADNIRLKKKENGVI